MDTLDGWLRRGPAPWPERVRAYEDLARMIVEDVDVLGRFPIDDAHRFVKCGHLMRDGLVVYADFARDDPSHASTTWAKHPNLATT